MLCPGFKTVRRLGEGGFGVVYLAEREKDKQIFAVKKLKITPVPSDRSMLDDEVFVLGQLSHPNIVSFVELIEARHHKYIVMEYCEGGDLRSLISMAVKSKNRIAEDKVCDIFTQILLALHHCHHSYQGDWTLLHRDIKPENVLFDASGRVKLADFGLSRILDGSQNCAISLVGTAGYISPEALAGKPYDVKADMFSLGCLLYELCFLQCPGFGEVQRLLNGTHQLPSPYSLQLQQIVQAMLKLVPSERPSTADLLSRRCVSQWLQMNRSSGMLMSSIDTHQVVARNDEREQQLQLREQNLKAKERVLAAREASMEAQLRRLAARASLSTGAIPRTRAVTKSPSPFQW